MVTKVVLDFEKPLFELEAKLNEMRQCLRSSTREQTQSEVDSLYNDIEVQVLLSSLYFFLTETSSIPTGW